MTLDARRLQASASSASGSGASDGLGLHPLRGAAPKQAAAAAGGSSAGASLALAASHHGAASKSTGHLPGMLAGYAPNSVEHAQLVATMAALTMGHMGYGPGLAQGMAAHNSMSAASMQGAGFMPFPGVPVWPPMPLPVAADGAGPGSSRERRSSESAAQGQAGSTSSISTMPGAGGSGSSAASGSPGTPPDAAAQAGQQDMGPRVGAPFPPMLAMPGGMLPPMFWQHPGAMHPGMLPSQQLGASGPGTPFGSAGKGGRVAADVAAQQQLAAMQHHQLQLLAAHMLHINPAQGAAIMQQLQLQAQAQAAAAAHAAAMQHGQAPGKGLGHGRTPQRSASYVEESFAGAGAPGAGGERGRHHLPHAEPLPSRAGWHSESGSASAPPSAVSEGRAQQQQARLGYGSGPTASGQALASAPVVGGASTLPAAGPASSSRAGKAPSAPATPRAAGGALAADALMMDGGMGADAARAVGKGNGGTGQADEGAYSQPRGPGRQHAAMHAPQAWAGESGAAYAHAGQASRVLAAGSAFGMPTTTSTAASATSSAAGSRYAPRSPLGCGRRCCMPARVLTTGLAGTACMVV